MNPAAPFFTVFTPTYNRAHTLERVHRSLLAQTYRDFEWLIVDDGSTDPTAELVRRWLDEGALTIRYLRQPNSGKHVAFNHGVREARGQMFVPIDSDDACLPESLEKFRRHWMSIDESERVRFAGVVGLCCDENGEVIGGPLPKDVIDAPFYDIVSRFHRSGEMWGCARTSILKACPFPEFPGERFVPEALVWNRIGRSFLSRVVNDVVRVYFRSSESLSNTSVRLRISSPRATLTYYGETTDLPIRLSLRLRAATNLCRFALASARFSEAAPFFNRHPVLVMLGLLPGVLLAWRDRLDGAGGIPRMFQHIRAR